MNKGQGLMPHYQLVTELVAGPAHILYPITLLSCNR